MPLFKKSILRARKYQSPDGEINLDSARLKHWQDSFKRMADEGLEVPVAFDHSDDPTKTLPVTKAEYAKQLSAKNVVGKLADFELGSDADGEFAVLTLDIPDEEAAAKAEHNLVDISPVIHERFRDGQKTDWLDVFGHVDLVVHPVDHKQGEFVPVEAIACGLRMSLKSGRKSKLSGVYRMADDQEIDDSNTDPKPVEENQDLPAVGKSDDEKRLESVLAYLVELTGISLQSDTDGSNFMERLQTALMTAKAVKDKAAEEAANDEPEEENDDMPNALTETSPAFAAMSLQVNRMNQDRIRRELDDCLAAGQITKAEFDKQAAALGQVKMSLDASGQPVASEVEKFIENRKALPRGAAVPFTDRLRMANADLMKEVQPPMANDLPTSDEDSEGVVGDIFKRNRVATSSAR